MGYSAEQYAFLFEQEQAISENAFEDLRHDRVARYRTKTITSGEQVEVEIYPIWITGSEVRAAKRHTSREAQRRLNRKNAEKKFIRLANCNFVEGDLAITLTYRGDPPSLEQARKDAANFIRRLRRHCVRAGLPELRYLYVIEGHDEETDSPRKRVHLHFLLPAMDRDVVEGIWDKGFANCRRLQPDRYGLEAIARYMLKDPKGRKRWGYSRNLRKPKVTTSDHRMSRRQVEQLAMDLETMGPAIFAKHYPACVLNELPTIRTSGIVPGAYIYVRMHKDEPDKRRRPYGRPRRGPKSQDHIPGRQDHRRSGLQSQIPARC